MPGSAQIRLTEGDWAIFKDVLTSLESHHPSKAEKDILDEIREYFRLPKEENSWPAILVERGVSVETFLDFVLDRITPFVEMVLDLPLSFIKKTAR
jgi:hypothetical protein